ncbi:MAG: hypothetical protein IKR66_06275, partial [Bacteroidales bacterium]|nr:hypothetical protein [Bacteroidales bacterium]
HKKKWNRFFCRCRQKVTERNGTKSTRQKMLIFVAVGLQIRPNRNPPQQAGQGNKNFTFLPKPL